MTIVEEDRQNDETVISSIKLSESKEGNNDNNKENSADIKNNEDTTIQQESNTEKKKKKKKNKSKKKKEIEITDADFGPIVDFTKNEGFVYDPKKAEVDNDDIQLKKRQWEIPDVRSIAYLRRLGMFQ